MNKRFMLTAAGAAATGIAGSASAVLVNFTHELDRWAGEHAWQVHENSVNGTVVASQYVAGSIYYAGCSITAFTSYPATSSHWGTVNGNMDLVASTTYVVTMQDSYGDGWAWGSFVGGLTIGSASGTVSGSSATFSFHAAPAPGALALLGLAGIAGTRRRK